MVKTDFSKVNMDLQKKIERNKQFEEGSGSKFVKTEWMKIPFGDTTFGLLPPKTEDAELFKPVTIHYDSMNVEDKEGEKRIVNTVHLCTKEKFGTCPYCEEHESLSKSEKDSDKDRANDIKPQKGFLANVFDTNLNVKQAFFKSSMHTEILQEINTKYIDDGDDATDPSQGFMIKLSRLKSQPWARARILSKKIEISQSKIEDMLSKCRDLNTVYTEVTPDKLKLALSGENIYKFQSKNTPELKTASDVKTVTETKKETATKEEAKAQSPKKDVNVKVETKSIPKKSSEPEDDEFQALLNELEMD